MRYGHMEAMVLAMRTQTLYSISFETLTRRWISHNLFLIDKEPIFQWKFNTAYQIDFPDLV